MINCEKIDCEEIVLLGLLGSPIKLYPAQLQTK